MSLIDILNRAITKDASDIFIISGIPVTYKIRGIQERQESDVLMPDAINEIVREVYELAQRSEDILIKNNDDDFSFALHDLGRFRVNIFRQRGSLAAVIRVIKFGVPDPAELGIPESVLSMADYKNGLVLVTGAAGCGKSTTLACIIDRINSNREAHIITMEDPLEHIHAHKRSIVSQREIYIDSPGYLESLRSALRESPDVILLGEMRDLETTSAAITAAETGVLLLSTLHTSSAANTISRIVDMFPASQQVQIRGQLAQLLKGVVCQQLVASVEGTMIPAFEIMKTTPAVYNMIREGKLYQLESAIQAASAEGMITMDQSLLDLYSSGKITKSTLLSSCNNYEYITRKVGN